MVLAQSAGAAMVISNTLPTWPMSQYVYIYIYIYIYIYHHHHHVALVARISLTLSRHSSLSFIALGRSSGQHPVSSHSCWMYVRAGRPAFARPCVGVHKSTSLMSSSLLLQQCPVESWINQTLKTGLQARYFVLLFHFQFFKNSVHNFFLNLKN